MRYTVTFSGSGRYPVLTEGGWVYVEGGVPATLFLSATVAADLVANGLTVEPA